MRRQALTLLSAAALIFAANDDAFAGKRDRQGHRPRAHAGTGGLPVTTRPTYRSTNPRVGNPRRGVVARRPAAAGRYVWQVQRVFIPGRYEDRQVERRTPDRYEMQEQRVWEPGCVTFRDERYLVRAGHHRVEFLPGQCPPVRRVWCPPVYGVRKVRVESRGRWVVKCVRVCIPGEIRRVCERVWCPPRHENKRIRVWVPGAVCTVRR